MNLFWDMMSRLYVSELVIYSDLYADKCEVVIGVFREPWYWFCHKRGYFGVAMYVERCGWDVVNPIPISYCFVVDVECQNAKLLRF